MTVSDDFDLILNCLNMQNTSYKKMLLEVELSSLAFRAI